MSGRFVECSTKEQLQQIIAAGDIAVLRGGYWEASGNATVEASDNATVTAIARAIVRVLSATVTVHASDWATVILHAAATYVAEGSAIVIDRIIRTVQDWALAHGAKRTDDGKLTLLKYVCEDGTSRCFAYPEGQEVEAPDWDPNPKIECGRGLHACANLIDCEGFHDERPRLAVQLIVDPADCRTPQPDDQFPMKIRFRRAFVQRVWDADKEQASGQ